MFGFVIETGIGPEYVAERRHWWQRRVTRDIHRVRWYGSRRLAEDAAIRLRSRGRSAKVRTIGLQVSDLKAEP